MYLELKNNKLYCYGIGIVKYKDSYIKLFPYAEIDTCIKSFSVGKHDIGVTDSRDMTYGLSIVVNTYMSLFFTSSLLFTGYFLIKKLRK